MDRILVTNALPYANGEIHLGHLMEHIQTDIWVRYQRQIGKECTFVCADDAHGTATSLSAQKQNKDVIEWIDEMRISHEADLRAFAISYDNYYSTHSPENKELSEEIYQALLAQDLLNKRTIKQLYDEEKQLFLADRFIKGTCPVCKTPDQYGDNCEVCGSTYDALDLIEPYSLLSDSKPVIRDSEHLFFDLSAMSGMLKDWSKSGSLQKEVRNKLDEWFDKGLQEWNISRDAPYFGWLIPGYQDKYFYVWLDAPIGYMASLANLCAKNNWDFKKDFWQNPKCEIYHFIGKDIIYFHSLFWPAILDAAGYNKPSGIFAHGFLTVNGAKMSKSRGTFILAKKYLSHLNPEYLRYYFATKLQSSVEDYDFNTKEFGERINSDLIGKYVNIASRCARFINQDFNNLLSTSLDDEQQEIIRDFARAGDEIGSLYYERKYAMAMRRIMELADMINRYISETKPWEISANNKTDPQVQQICSTGINCFRILSIYLNPVIPEVVAKSAELTNTDDMSWSKKDEVLTDHKISKFSPLLARIDSKDIEAIISS